MAFTWLHNFQGWGDQSGGWRAEPLSYREAWKHGIEGWGAARAGVRGSSWAKVWGQDGGRPSRRFSGTVGPASQMLLPSPHPGHPRDLHGPSLPTPQPSRWPVLAPLWGQILHRGPGPLPAGLLSVTHWAHAQLQTQQPLWGRNSHLATCWTAARVATPPQSCREAPSSTLAGRTQEPSSKSLPSEAERVTHCGSDGVNGAPAPHNPERQIHILAL